MLATSSHRRPPSLEALASELCMSEPQQATGREGVHPAPALTTPPTGVLASAQALLKAR